MGKGFVSKIVLFIFIIIITEGLVYAANDYPHNWVNNIGCDSCHFVYGSQPALMPPWTVHLPQDIDDTQFNTLCWSCHNDIDAVYERTHSSLQIDDSYGDWSVECRTCHNPHSQRQYRMNPGSEMYSAVSSEIQTNQPVTGRSLLILTDAGWTVDAYKGLVVIPNILKKDSAYKIVSNTSDTLTVEGVINLNNVTPGIDTFAIIYGKLINETVKLYDIIGHLGVLTGVPDVNTLEQTGAGWTVDAFQGAKVTPNISQGGLTYTVLSNTSETLTVQGPMNLSKVAPGDTFKITSIKTGNKTVRFLRATGVNSFADGDGTYDGICEACHTKTDHFRNNGGGPDQLHVNMGSPAGTNCTDCHKHINGFQGMGGGAHPTHVIDDNGPQITCYDCHQPGNIPFFKSGTDSNGDGKYELSETDVCTNCHSSNGVISAKTYWIDDPGTWTTTGGEQDFCGSCHDATPGNTKGDGTGDTALNITGDSSTYGFYVTGHGKVSGNYPRLSWQATIETGNPAANRQCSACHDLSSVHFNNPTARLKAGFQNDENNSNCRQCHDPGTVAVGGPQWYTTYAEYENSAHSGRKCSECHDVHGASGAYTGMTKAQHEDLCFQCHTQGMIQNNAISGPGLADDIQQAFSFGDSSRHSLGASYTISPYSYNLECVSCHNVHLVTGKYWEADLNKTPVTRISTPSNPEGNLEIWGDETNEKMDAYGGTYRTPNGETFSGAQLPNYTGFCNECHQPMPDPKNQSGAHGQLNFDSDPHGLNSANQPNGYGTCPNWFTCGKATGWDGDDCIGTETECWPVITRGKGDQLFSRAPFNHEERIAGANFALSCTNCHEAHGSSAGALLRTNPNNGTGTIIWNTMCNNCHYYYSDWHAGMSCGNASCHVSDSSDRMYYTGTNTLHRMGNRYGSGGTRTFNPDLVLDYRFENSLKDSGTWQMDGQWMDGVAGSFATGKSGQSVMLDGGRNIQVGTENDRWSTDEGYHGTWKYTEMKFNTTLEAWVYPTDDAADEYIIFSKHTGYSDGGYQFALRKINNSLRASFNMMADSNGFTQGGKSSARGAYSSVTIPLNTWTHVAATFDKNGPDKDTGDPSVGRIRIYVNGEDVTTSKASGSDSQPVAGETSIYAYSENSPWNQSICYNGTWCASEFSIGGFYGWQNEFIGRIDEAKVWNVTKDAAYFASYDAMGAPYISAVEGVIGGNQLTVTFSEGVFTNMGPSGDLVPGDFVFTDTDDARSINSVTHTAGSSTAILTLSTPLDDVNDINTDSLSASGSSIFDDYNEAAATNSVKVTLTSSCPTGTVTFNLNETSGSAYVLDTQSILSGVVTGGGDALTGNAFSGDGSSRYIDFENNDTCLQATTSMTLEARIKPTGIPSDGSNYIRRILARDGGGNYQMSVWRNNDTTEEDPPGDVVMIALWVKPEDAHGGNAWKVTLTDFNTCPIVNDRWYQVKAVWNSGIVGGMPSAIYIDDQGANGDNSGESWAGYINCTDSDQSQAPASSKVFEGDVISPSDGDFVIGANVNNHINNVFWGLIDWITWKNSVD
ncbi:MAG: cytochrome c3 family protein [Nitrospirota bacterium]